MRHYMQHERLTGNKVATDKVIRDGYEAEAAQTLEMVNCDDDEKYIRELRQNLGSPTTMVTLKDKSVVDTRHLSSILSSH